MAFPPRWIPLLAIVGALLIGCVVAWRSYVFHHRARVPAPIVRPGHALIYPDARYWQG